jgi:GT2 family glycosyltransferase
MISIVICSITPTNLQAARRNLSALLADEPHEFISITDAKSLAEGYNRGVRQARGELLVLCHDDIEVISPDFRQILLSRLQRFDLIGVAGATQLKGPRWLQAGPPHIFGQIAHYIQTEQAYDVVVWSVPARAIPGICVMDGVFLAGKRKVFENVQFDEQTFDGFHLYDLDFTFRAARSGFRLGVCTDLAIIHASIGSYDQAWERLTNIRNHSRTAPAITGRRWAYASAARNTSTRSCVPATGPPPMFKANSSALRADCPTRSPVPQSRCRSIAYAAGIAMR